MKLLFLTIEIDGECFDLPKDMQIPEKGDVVFIGGKAGVVDKKHYHIEGGKVHMISIFTIKE